MTIIVFLVDTSASMNQRAYLGGRPSLLDVAKGAVETFVKMRQRSPESRGDRYMLLSFEEAPYNIKAAWKENLGTFMNELKNLQATGMTTFGGALKAAFDLLNINRMQTGIDMYGQGRYPFYLEPAVIVAITDGGKMTNVGGVQEELVLPMTPNIPGAELTREPFRWDQRLFSLVLRLTGTPPLERDAVAQGGLVPIDSSPIETMCEVTGGRSFAISSHRMLMQCVESLVQKIQSGVVVYFEKIGPDPPLIPPDGKMDNGSGGEALYDGDDSRAAGTNSWHCCRKMIYVPRSAQKGFAVGFWPMPEAFWPDTNAPSLPPRSAHPIIKFTCTNQEPMVIENLPFDKYEVEPCPLTRFILSRKQATTCWQVFMGSSSKSTEIGYPFGYLKASSNLQSVNLFVMPYNYPALLPLLDDLFKVHRLKPNSEWRTQFANYLRTMPPYYAAPLRRALTRMGASNIAASLIPETLDNLLSYSVVNYLKRLKNQAKAEFDRFCSEVGRQRPPASDTVKVVPRSTFRKDFLTNPNLCGKFAHLKDQLNEFLGFSLVVREREVRSHSLRNPFDIPRASLLDQVSRMRANFLQPSLAHTRLQDNDHVHSMPVSQMGNYQEYLKRIPPALREIESTPVRQHMFGNPFKIDKRMMVDEADIDLVGGGSNQGTGRGVKRTPESMSPSSPLRPMKRKPGPLSRDIVIRRPQSPVPSPDLYTPPASPVATDTHVQTTENAVIEPEPILNTVSEAPPIVVLLDETPKIQPEPEKPPPSVEVLPVMSEVPETVREDHVAVDSPAPVPPLRLHNGVADNRLAVNGTGPPERKAPPNGISSMTKAELHEIQQHNNSIRAHLFKLVRRPGKKYEEIFRNLTQLRGSPELRKPVALEVITECLRFKRRLLADLVTQWMHNAEPCR